MPQKNIKQIYKELHRIKESHISELDLSTDFSDRQGTSEWNAKRKELLEARGEECEWCEATDGPFHIHHTSQTDLGSQWFIATDEAFTESNSYDPSTTKDREECPDCGLKDYYARKTKSPTYRCSCGAEFESPKEVSGKNAIIGERYDTKPYVTAQYLADKLNWVQEHTDRVKEQFISRYTDILDTYESLQSDEVVVICESCHYKEEQTSLRLCSVCNSNWHKRNKSKCWDCLVEAENLKECSCGDGWYSADKYSQCADCRS